MDLSYVIFFMKNVIRRKTLKKNVEILKTLAVSFFVKNNDTKENWFWKVFR